jgi:hypothetical protein
METPRRAPLRSCRTPDAPRKKPKTTSDAGGAGASRSLVFEAKKLNQEAMLETAENLQEDLKTYLKTLDADVFGFVTFCLAELVETQKTGCWFCSSMEKAVALAKTLKFLSDALVTLNNHPDSNSYDFFAVWSKFYHGIPKFTTVYSTV